LAQPALVAELSPEQLASLIGQLEQLKALCWARLVSPVTTKEAKPEQAEKDRMLTTAEAAAMLRRKPSWLYRHSHLPFVVKRTSPRSPLLCSEQGIRRYLARR
jgi:hypothetical protein